MSANASHSQAAFFLQQCSYFASSNCSCTMDAGGDGGGCIQYKLTLTICGNRFSFGFAARTHCVGAQNATLGLFGPCLGANSCL